MMRASAFPLIPVLIAHACAGEVAVELRPFSVVSRFEAVAAAADPLVVRGNGLLAEVSEIAPHGTKVEAGALLLRFDGLALEKEIAEAEQRSETAELRLERAVSASRQLSESALLKIEALREQARKAKAEAAEFEARGKKAEEEKAAALADEAEKERMLKISIPRKAADLALRAKQADQSLAHAEESFRGESKPLAAEVARSEQSVKTATARLAELLKLRSAVERKAPAAGWWFHGAPPTASDAVGPVRGHFVPADAPVGLVAKVSASVAGSLSAGDEGIGHFAGRGQPVMSLKVSRVAVAPEPDGRWRIDLSAVWPEGRSPVPGAVVEANLATHRKEAAISVPTEALSYGGGGWTVEVKLADGKAEARPVVPGFVSGGRTEIISGIEPGQVILVP